VADRHELAAVAVVSDAAAGSVARAPATRSGPAVAARSLYRFFRAGEEETLALQGVSLEVGAGELVAIVGPSGSGKSTLLGCLAGLDQPDGGTVWIEGRRISHQPEPVRARLRAERIGYVGQSANLFPHLTVEENLLLVRRLTGRAVGGSIAERLGAVGLAGRARAYPDELSGGEAARAGLAVALAADPAVVLADEPTGELDSVTEDAVLELMQLATQRGVAVVLAGHSTAVAAVAGRVVLLRDGRVVT
jgi:putative ABC transport system ATP-binding protein